jgi:hypothetical protein
MTREAEIEARLEKAAKGPWSLHTCDGRIQFLHRGPSSPGESATIEGSVSRKDKGGYESICKFGPYYDGNEIRQKVTADAELIAHAPDDLRYLLGRR